MTEFMFLLEVFDSDGNLFKRRIADSIDAIEDWLDVNAPLWGLWSVLIDDDGFGNGYIYEYVSEDELLEAVEDASYSFRTTNIAVI